MDECVAKENAIKAYTFSTKKTIERTSYYRKSIIQNKELIEQAITNNDSKRAPYIEHCHARLQ